ncbi:ABC transporter substrate-binding protein [Paracoccus sp. CPCC 101403]|uniref:ABC transporter substrate-binding protein n=1 Tax=Paracoccus broussonetiae TaxID=3075834 RepID=A0ABU3EFV7_9RHOB|nr:ABC transporter substrate-binding protein [Paracoccus sp. CPCC 101403]MDT1062707.1 ABC transporter substrate-binding protein [Paracoccus sp. CPCC 101403]
MTGRIIILLAGLGIAAPAIAQQAAQAGGQKPMQIVHAAVLRVDVPELPPISRLDTPPADLGFAGARLAIEDNDTTGRFMGQDFEAAEIAATPETAAAEMDKLLSQGVTFIVTLADEDQTLKLSDQVGDRATLLNARARGDRLRGKDCRANVIHTAPSHAMLADGLAQFLMWKKWSDWFLISGSHPEDIALADAYRRAAKKFGAKIVEERTYEDTGGGRRTDSGYVQVQQQMPVFTQRAADHQIVIAADEAGVFAPWLPYQTWDPRPVAGSAGLVPRSWHPALEAWGATQFQNRFEKLATRRMWDEDYQTWLALRMIGEAATRTQSTDPVKLKEFMLSDKFEVAGFKGQKLTMRDWDHQLRQPILLTTGDVTSSVSPQDQYLHQSSALDTLGIDRPETECKF